MNSATMTTDGRYFIKARIMGPDASTVAATIPGARRSGMDWAYPLSMDTCRAFREVFGNDLTILPPLTEWARKAVQKEADKSLNPRNCIRCKKPLTVARLRNNKRICQTCERTGKRESRERSHERYVGDMYGLEPGDYGLLLENQGGRCAVKKCRANGATKWLGVEHDHKLGNTRESVRGLMCSRHNEWIAIAGDDPEVFDSIAEYLRNPPAHRVLQREYD